MMKRRQIMSDNEIRQILIERKRQERKQIKRRAMLLEVAEGLIGWASLFGICFMLSVIGG